MQLRAHYTIDIRETDLPIRELDAETLASDLELLELKRPLDLDLTDNFNTKIFETEKKAEAWRSKFRKKRTELISTAKKDALPKLLCKRRYIVLTALGEK